MKAGDRFNPYGHFFGLWVPDWLAERFELSPGAKLLYSSLARHAGKDGECFPGQTRLGRVLGLKGTVESQERTIRKFTKELLDAALVESVQRGLGMTNMYFFLWHPWMEGKVRPDCDAQANKMASDSADPDSTSLPGGVSAQELSKASAPERTPKSGPELAEASAQERVPESDKESQGEEDQVQEIQGEERNQTNQPPRQMLEPTPAQAFGGTNGGGDHDWQELTQEEKEHLAAALWQQDAAGKPVSNEGGFRTALLKRWRRDGFNTRDLQTLAAWRLATTGASLQHQHDGHSGFDQVDYLMGAKTNTMSMAEGIRLMRAQQARRRSTS